MPTNRNQLRQDAVEFAALVNKICAKIKERSYYTERMYHAVVVIGSTLTSLRNSRDEVSLVRRLNVAIDACSEIMFVAKLLLVEKFLFEDDYKLIKKSVSSIERRMISCLSD